MSPYLLLTTLSIVFSTAFGVDWVLKKSSTSIKYKIGVLALFLATGINIAIIAHSH